MKKVVELLDLKNLLTVLYSQQNILVTYIKKTIKNLKFISVYMLNKFHTFYDY